MFRHPTPQPIIDMLAELDESVLQTINPIALIRQKKSLHTNTTIKIAHKTFLQTHKKLMYGYEILLASQPFTSTSLFLIEPYKI